MGTFGTGPFSSDGALDFLEELAERPPRQRAEALERMFLLVKERPDLLGQEFFANEVVAAAAIVAATLPGGRQFDERLNTLVENDIASDGRLSAPVPELASVALEALMFVSGPQGPWLQGWKNDTDAGEARDTIAALSQVLSLGGGKLDDLDVIWNEAADYGADGEVPDGTPSGIEQLASLLRVHNCAMGGGLGFALEVNEPFRVRRAINAMRYFELAETAEFLENVLDRSLNGESPESLPSDDDFYDLIDDETVRRAFKAKVAQIPADFGRG
ncbi:DUF4259 domain-containing protein [Actinoplanes hulinensis]|uniref:DUF4259 domain-containing protein n=1 Tax=Actinoplanes hulinensis TaxID=1144547 RepID=A0ABS7B2S4_9ACTN|nr:DUF4259 domain-containing protein [Actinoplanes hulinensis]MBW6435326.1 DUF4259 domain-containing protein [Actinoplanes hulinensis]